MDSTALPGIPEPVRADVRAVPVLNPVLLAVAGVLYGAVLGVLLLVWWGIDALVGVPAPAVSLRTAGTLWAVGVGLALVRDTLRKRRMSVAVYPGWVVRSFGANTVVVPVAEIRRVRTRRTIADRLAGTRTFDIYDETGHRLRVSRVREAGRLERALAEWIDAETDHGSGDDPGP